MGGRDEADPLAVALKELSDLGSSQVLAPTASVTPRPCT